MAKKPMLLKNSILTLMIFLDKTFTRTFLSCSLSVLIIVRNFESSAYVNVMTYIYINSSTLIIFFVFIWKTKCLTVVICLALFFFFFFTYHFVWESGYTIHQNNSDWSLFTESDIISLLGKKNSVKFSQPLWTWSKSRWKKE